MNDVNWLTLQRDRYHHFWNPVSVSLLHLFTLINQMNIVLIFIRISDVSPHTTCRVPLEMPGRAAKFASFIKG